MADLASSGVVLLRSWYIGQNKVLVARKVRLTLSTMGTAANKISASVLGFASIEKATVLTASDNSVVIVGAPSYDKSQLLLKAAGSNAPADYSGTFECVIVGVPL